MKKTTPASTHEWQTLNRLTMQELVTIVGGNTGPATEAKSPTAPVYTTTSNEAPTIPSSNQGRPPFN